MQTSEQAKNAPSFEVNHRDSLDLGSIEGIPLAAPELRRLSELRTNPLFFSALLTSVGQDAAPVSPVYPWMRPPQVWAVHKGKVLSAQQGIPIDMTDLLNFSALGDYAAAEQEVADIIYAGETERDGQKVPVLACINRHETYLRENYLNMQGPENQELTVEEYLAERTGASWLPIYSYAALTLDAGDDCQLVYDAHVLTSANALANWHSSHRFDPATGEPTTLIQAGWARKTTRGTDLFPRTDPAIITAVTARIDGVEKLLLGNARAWEEHRYSTFAGFVEAGESLENAVARELFEECGGIVEAMSYRGSQPWPFPRSLMLGYTARISNPESVRADGEEIRQIRWFSREELREAADSGEIVLPGTASISSKLIDDWLHHADR